MESRDICDCGPGGRTGSRPRPQGLGKAPAALEEDGGGAKRTRASLRPIPSRCSVSPVPSATPSKRAKNAAWRSLRRAFLRRRVRRVRRGRRCRRRGCAGRSGRMHRLPRAAQTVWLDEGGPPSSRSRARPPARRPASCMTVFSSSSSSIRACEVSAAGAPAHRELAEHLFGGRVALLRAPLDAALHDRLEVFRDRVAAAGDERGRVGRELRLRELHVGASPKMCAPATAR